MVFSDFRIRWGIDQEKGGVGRGGQCLFKVLGGQPTFALGVNVCKRFLKTVVQLIESRADLAGGEGHS